MRRIILSFLLSICFSVLCLGQSAKLNTKDIDILLGDEWNGTLSYSDYSSGKMVSIPSKLTIRKSKNKKSTWIFDYRYPNEPGSNSTETVVLSDNRKLFDGETITEKTKLPNKILRIVTEKNGQDNDKKAIFRYTYLISKTVFSVKKEVRYEDGKEFFIRNEYSWKR